MNRTVGSPKPATAWPRSSTPVAASAMEAPTATSSTGKRFHTNSTTTAASTHSVMAASDTT